MTFEAKLERDFCKWCRDRQIEPIKGPSAFAKGFPDRFVQLPRGGGTLYVEFKGDDLYYDLSKIQAWWKKYLIDSSPNRYFVVDSEEKLEQLKNTCVRLTTIGVKLIEHENYLLKTLKM